IQKTWICLKWLDIALKAKNDDSFFAAWELFAHLCERNVVPVAAQRINDRLSSRTQAQKDFIGLRWKQIYEQSLKSESELKDKLFSFRVGYRWARPWADT